MNTLHGDIWQLSTLQDSIVIPTNVGWKRRDGKNPMGKGLAYQAAKRFKFLPTLYGDFCRQHGAETPIMTLRVTRWCHYLILLPTKELDVQQPYLSWRQPTCIEALTVRLQALQHKAHVFKTGKSPYPHYRPGTRILVPSLGCGHGDLDETLLISLLNKYLTHLSFVHVQYKA
jgi:hypothetical protein